MNLIHAFSGAEISAGDCNGVVKSRARYRHISECGQTWAGGKYHCVGWGGGRDSAIDRRAWTWIGSSLFLNISTFFFLYNISEIKAVNQFTCGITFDYLIVKSRSWWAPIVAEAVGGAAWIAVWVVGERKAAFLSIKLVKAHVNVELDVGRVGDLDNATKLDHIWRLDIARPVVIRARLIKLVAKWARRWRCATGESRGLKRGRVGYLQNLVGHAVNADRRTPRPVDRVANTYVYKWNAPRIAGTVIFA